MIENQNDSSENSQNFSEDIFEEKIELLSSNLKSSLLQLKNLRNQVEEAESEVIGLKLEIDSLQEDLRRFRLKYPEKCRLTK